MSIAHKSIRLNYSFCVPRECYKKSDNALLQEKLRVVPTTCLDKLHPKSTETPPFVEYVDEGVWKSRITFHSDPSHTVAHNAAKARASTPHASLDALCEAEFKRRFPNGDQKKMPRHKKQIAYSACNRNDMKCSPLIEDPTLRKQLNLTDDSLLQTDHIFAKNSPMNGQSFIHKGKPVYLSQAIASSNDRDVETTGNMRVAQTKDKESICYAGRPDTDHKVLEQASFIFFNELQSSGKGITKTVDAQGNPFYELDYVVTSLMSIPWFSKKKLPRGPDPERRYVENEKSAMNKLRESGVVAIEDPNCPGTIYKVKFNPILFSRPLNLISKLKNWLPPFLTGESRSRTINEEGMENLRQVAQQRWNTLTQQQKTTVEEILKILSDNECNPSLHAEEQLLYCDYLCKLLGLPPVYHCKSSTDRTSIAYALSTALQQWIDLKLPIPSPLTDLIKDHRFKELFAANWMVGHQITRYARGGKGTVEGVKLNNKNLGLMLSRGVAQYASVARLLPERYLTDFPSAEKNKLAALYALLLIPLSIFLYIPLILMTACRHLLYLATLGKHFKPGPLKFMLPILPATLLFNFHTIISSKVLNENSPQVGDRKLIAGKKKAG